MREYGFGLDHEKALTFETIEGASRCALEYDQVVRVAEDGEPDQVFRKTRSEELLPIWSRRIDDLKVHPAPRRSPYWEFRSRRN
jgi:hypothetical protein